MPVATGASSTSNVSRPFAYTAGAPLLRAVIATSREKSWLRYAVTRRCCCSNHFVVMWPRRTK